METERSNSISNNLIDECIEFGLKNGAIGAKLVEVGGGGLYCSILKIRN